MPVEPRPGTDREQRRPVALPAKVLLPGGIGVDVTILDMNYGGCKLETPLTLIVGSKVKLAVPKLGELDAEVRWCAARRLGLMFLHPEAAGCEAAAEERGAAPSTTVLLRRTGKIHYQTHVYDLTPTSCTVDFVERPSVGEQLWAKFEGLDSLEAKVSWVEGFRGGLEFSRPIHPAVFDVLQKTLR